MTSENNQISYTFPTDNQELIRACIRDLMVHGWELAAKTEESGCTTITFIKK